MATDARGLRPCLLAAALAACSGCLAPRGILYTYATTPYTLPDEGAARRGGKRCTVDITQLKEPVSRANLSVLWTNRGVREAAARAGRTELRYADIQTLSLLNGVYARRRLIFYGE